MTGSSAPLTTPTQSVPIVLRALRSLDDYTACVQLQRDTWGQNYMDCVPASVLKVSQRVGGVTAGAFTPEGRMVGFVYGLTGLRDGRLIHWSHMLAVHPEYRNHGVGRRLKEYQREVLRGTGIEMIYWTFDPLVARNAHLNLNRLGTQVCEYVPDMYGDTGSELHAFGTDRFVVSWPVAADVRVAAAHLTDVWRASPVANGLASAAGGEPPIVSLNSKSVGGEPGIVSVHPAGAAEATVLRVEIPADVESLPVSEARAWRASTRPVFLRLMAAGYRVSGFFADEGTRCFYVLVRELPGQEPRC